MDTSRLATEALQTLAGRFDIDLRFRTEGWGKGPARWKVRILTNKNQDEAFRLTAYGITALEAVAAISGMVTVVEQTQMKTVRRRTIARLASRHNGIRSNGAGQGYSPPLS